MQKVEDALGVRGVWMEQQQYAGALESNDMMSAVARSTEAICRVSGAWSSAFAAWGFGEQCWAQKGKEMAIWHEVLNPGKGY